MTSPLLVLDVHYLAHRAFHTMKDLSWEGKATGVVFGLLKSISHFKDEFQTDQIAFCFEHPHLLRRDIYSDYKLRRKTAPRTQEEQEHYGDLARQIKLLRTDYLPRIGFKNVFCYDGYEADDIMAALADLYREPLGRIDGVILVTSDQDLYQCLGGEVGIYNPVAQMVRNENWFTKKYGISPKDWAMVKELSGCSGDGVKGIPGIGEKTAIKIIQGNGKMDKWRKVINEQYRELRQLNRKLVKLPFKGCPVPTIQEDEIDPKAWRDVCKDLGMKSIAGKPPVVTRKLGLL